MSAAEVSGHPQVKIDKDSIKEHDTKQGDLGAAEGPIVSQWKRRQSIMSKNSSVTDTSDPIKDRLNRRRSTFKGLATSILGSLNMRRMTKTSSQLQPLKPVVKMENTYKMVPDDGKEIQTSKIKRLVQHTLESHLADETYCPYRSGKMACDLSGIIKNQMKDMNFPRYKFICHVIIGQCGGQGMQISSRCVWAPTTDNYEYVTYTNGSLFAVATIYGIYYE